MSCYFVYTLFIFRNAHDALLFCLTKMICNWFMMEWYKKWKDVLIKSANNISTRYETFSQLYTDNDQFVLWGADHLHIHFVISIITVLSKSRVKSFCGKKKIVVHNRHFWYMIKTRNMSIGHGCPCQMHWLCFYKRPITLSKISRL